MKIAIIRGPNLNPYEMQSYRPLTERHEIVGFGSNLAPFDGEAEGVKVQRLACLADRAAAMPPLLRRGAWRLAQALWGPRCSRLDGLEEHLRGFDILHTAETHNGYSQQALRAKARWGGVLVVTVWETRPHNFEGHPLVRRVKQEIRAGADHFIAATERAKKALLAEGVEEARVSVVYPGVDLGVFSEGAPDAARRAELGLADGTPTILFVGRLVPEKGVSELVRALAYLETAYNLRPNLLLVGEGRARGRLQAEARRLGLENRVRFCGNLSYRQVPAVYRLADVFVLPSRETGNWEEQFGLVLAEAMASGVPIIATRSGAIPEVVKDAGFLVLPKYPEEMAEALALLLRREELRAALATRGRRRARKHFSHLHTAASIEAIYEKLAG